METTKKSLLIFLALVIIGGSAYGAFYLLKKYIKKTPETPSTGSTIGTTTNPVIDGFLRDNENKLPAAFPKGLIVEEGMVVLETFSIKNNRGSQDTYRYVTKLTSEKNYSHFQNVRLDGWKRAAPITIDSNWVINFSKLNSILSISYSPNTLTKEDVIDITLSTKNKE